MDRCFVIGRGPSLRGFDHGVLRGEYRISVNRAPEWANMVIFLDKSFDIGLLRGFGGAVCTSDNTGYPGDWIIPHRIGARNSLSGYTAVEVGLQLAERVYLLGFDMCVKDGISYDTGKMHPCYGDKGWLQRRLRRFESLPRDRVFNCTPGSALTCFDFVDLEDVLNPYRTLSMPV